jgi:hypothetical protein
VSLYQIVQWHAPDPSRAGNKILRKIGLDVKKFAQVHEQRKSASRCFKVQPDLPLANVLHFVVRRTRSLHIAVARENRGFRQCSWTMGTTGQKEIVFDGGTRFAMRMAVNVSDLEL